jgi:predicted molibdopterin-dependent oxidoreductase YjgC
LPATTFAESAGTFTNLEGRIQRLQPAIPPPGNARAGWVIPCQIAQKLGLTGFDFEGPEQIMDEIARLVPGYETDGQQTIDDKGWTKEPSLSVLRPFGGL